MGRKTKFDPEFIEKAEQLSAEGLIDVEIAKQLGISHNAYYTYQKKYNEFYESIKRGKSIVDNKVESKLLQRAEGYEYEETETKINGEGVTLWTKKTTKHVPPDVTAQTFWLKNRVPEKWRENYSVQANINSENKNININKNSEPTKEDVELAYKVLFTADIDKALEVMAANGRAIASAEDTENCPESGDDY